MLPSRRHKTSLQAGLGIRRIGQSRQQLALRAIELRLTPALAGAVDLFQRLIQQVEAVSSRARSCRENRYPCTDVRPERYGAEIDEGRHSRPQELDPASTLVRYRN